jgi:ATP-dependent HslUV protease ATP-binding subunit HslU
VSTGLTPRQIVAELDKYIIGQDAAKRSVAIAVRNRWRRLQLPADLRDEVAPKNIIMIGPTGVGKTEIARRLAQLVDAPFIKVEASKYTEVGYVGRDVESMIRELVDLSISMVKRAAVAEVEEKAAAIARARVLEILSQSPSPPFAAPGPFDPSAPFPAISREELARLLDEGKLAKAEIDVPVTERAVPMQIFSSMGLGSMEGDLQDFFEKMAPARTHMRKVTVAQALEILKSEEAEKLVDNEKIVSEALARAQNSGIIFIDEIDKIAGPGSQSGPDVSRQGVQRDLLPIVEGSTVNTRHGMVRTDHILFIAAGAFNMSKPSDLIPELQGRFPIRVELSSLGADEFLRILKEPKSALTRQYEALLATEGVIVVFRDESLVEIARIAAEVNSRAQNIGARRLMTVMEKLMEEVSFHAPDIRGQEIDVTTDYVRQRLADIVKDEDLSQYIL